jgi:hypothetical protein
MTKTKNNNNKNHLEQMKKNSFRGCCEWGILFAMLAKTEDILLKL